MSPYSYDDGYCYVDEKGYEIGRYPIGWDELKEKIINGSPVGRFVNNKKNFFFNLCDHSLTSVFC